jgi:hypothetical protein
MKDSSLALGWSKSLYRDSDRNTLMAILAAGIIGHGRVAAKALTKQPFINNAVQLFNRQTFIQPVKISQNIFSLPLGKVAALGHILPEHYILENFLNVDFRFSHSNKYTQ